MPPHRLVAAFAAGAALVGVGAGVALHLAVRSRPSPPAPHLPVLNGQAVWPAGKRPAPSFSLRDQNGDLVSMRGQRGHTVLLAFMDPLCREECPIEGRGLALANQQVAWSQRATLLVVNVNPGASAAQARVAGHKWGFTGNWHWLLGNRAQLARVWRAYDITVFEQTHDVVHSTAVYVIDPRGFERAGVIAPFLPQFVADDLRRLTSGAATARAAR